ncbi:MAG: tRNA (adenosine(37)-N6)-threonylcarbamoyltransferase complex ATPase subunit type 1 TsaE [Planctomycetaceae bacterium]|jgi:tRNA threonylcarbamoyladenosine biosynthesis protein TsaE|nr:tRNA (adenosine(37)-N6)-threonylcarbamoyltransferase complex ATPase subunit type 1 TsaE [Planctomycetaceae bacterium]MBT7918549.1 tRNA (adenosine(37)-N6)-threonylcarbamoyltransferase complex ATPase subunit type 1 TsaE [Planctomycetaceae bacterium]
MKHTYLSRSLSDTHKLGHHFVKCIPTGTTVALIGTLGAGKTAFVQGVGHECGIEANSITSPTFVLCNEYVGTNSIFHLDAYRLLDSDEFSQLGPEEMYQSKHYVFIEWADRVINCLPREYITIDIQIKSHDARLFVVRSTGTLNELVHKWMNSISNT